ncbi:MAG: VacJ family lipoprotein [Myxococcota bacterium]
MQSRKRQRASAPLAALVLLGVAAAAGSEDFGTEQLAEPVLYTAAVVPAGTPSPPDVALGLPVYSDFPDDLDAEYESDLDAQESRDPIEGVNRGTFAFNRFLDRWAFDPLTNGYQFLFPPSIREGIYNFFLNLETPVVFINQLFQLRGEEATFTLGRLLVNTTAGVGGFVDAADYVAGWTRTDADFGQTLAIWGAPSGAYLVVPILGPSTVRDFSGDLVDRLLDPLTYVIGPVMWWVPLEVSQGLSVRDAHIVELAQLEDSSVDFYAALRSAYLQSRDAQIRGISDDETEAAEWVVEVLPSRGPGG